LRCSPSSPTNSQSVCLSIPRGGITGVHHHAQLLGHFLMWISRCPSSISFPH
jgi:hypothetical protein